MKIFTRWASFSYRFFPCIALAFLCSCTRHYRISVDTYADRQFIPNGIRTGSSFAVVSAKDENPLFSKELTQKISQILRDRGHRVESITKADYVLIFNATITSTTKQISVAKYLPGETQTKRGTVRKKKGTVGKNNKHGESYSETTESSGTTIYVPEDYTFFTRTLGVRVCDAEMYRKDKKEEQIWSGLATSSGQDDDLREVADYLLIAIFSYFGDNTKKNVRIDIAEDNEKVQRLRSAFDAILPSSLAPLFNSSSGEVLIEKSILEDKERCLRYSWKL